MNEREPQPPRKSVWKNENNPFGIHCWGAGLALRERDLYRPSSLEQMAEETEKAKTKRLRRRNREQNKRDAS